jgi:hypothetical protein
MSIKNVVIGVLVSVSCIFGVVLTTLAKPPVDCHPLPRPWPICQFDAGDPTLYGLPNRQPVNGMTFCWMEYLVERASLQQDMVTMANDFCCPVYIWDVKFFDCHC